MPLKVEDAFSYATFAMIAVLAVSAIAFFVFGPGWGWFSQAIFPPSKAAPMPSPSPSPTPTVTPEAIASPSPLASPTPNATIEASLSPSPTPSPSPSTQPSLAPSPTPSPTPFGLPFSKSSFLITRRQGLGVSPAVAVRFGDLDADGQQDFVFFEGALSVSAFLNSGKRIWGWDNPPSEFLSGNSSAPGAVWDWDKDGRLEVAFFKYEGNSVFLVLAEGSSGVERNRLLLSVSSPSSLAVMPADFRKAGWKSDFAVIAANASVTKILFLDTTFNRLLEASVNASVGGGLAVTDLNGAGADEAVVGRIALNASGAIVWDAGFSETVEEISVADSFAGGASGGKQLAFAVGKQGVSVRGVDGKEVLSTPVSRAVHASPIVFSSGDSARQLAVVLETRENGLEQGLEVLNSGGGRVWDIARKKVSYANRPFSCSFSEKPLLFYAGKFYDERGVASFEEYGRGLACADVSGDGREELVALRDQGSLSYLEIYSNPVAAQPAVPKKTTDYAYLLEKGTLPATRGG